MFNSSCSKFTLDLQCESCNLVTLHCNKMICVVHDLNGLAGCFINQNVGLYDGSEKHIAVPC